MSSKFIHYLNPHTTHENIKRKMHALLFFPFVGSSHEKDLYISRIKFWHSLLHF